MSKGKAYAARKAKEARPQGDFYSTPKSLTRELAKIGELDGYNDILDPCAGEGAIVDVLHEVTGARIHASDLYTEYGNLRDIYDYEENSYDLVVTNFPFSEWDSMLRKALEIAPKVITIGRLNYFGTHQRNVSGLWSDLTDVYVFDRMVDYRTPMRLDGLFHVGALVTGWFVFQRETSGVSPQINLIDVQKYATLGAYKE
jgi:hypothetical protein